MKIEKWNVLKWKVFFLNKEKWKILDLTLNNVFNEINFFVVAINKKEL